MPYTTAARNTMLDALSPTQVSLHTGDPGTTGAAELSGGGYARQTATFAAASAGSRALSSTVTFSGPASTSTPYFGVWAGGTFLGGGATSGDPGTNAEGVVELTTATALTLT
jgi:hypothetical protein